MFVKHYAPNYMLAPIDNRASRFYWICPKVDRVIYTLDAICMRDIMILVQTVLQLFCSLYKIPKSEKRDNSDKYLQNFANI